MTAPVSSDLAWLGDLERAHAAGTPWLTEIIEDRPEGAYKGAYTYEDEQAARATLAAVNAVPTLIAELRKRDAALRAVLELHHPVPAVDVGPEGPYPRDICADCSEFWPCETARALAAHLAPATPPPPDQEPTAADSGALTSDRRQGAARTVNPVVDHHSERSAPAPAPSPTAEPLYPLSRRCCGAADATACHQYGLCQMQGVHPSSGDATARRLVWFTNDELRAELTRRAALSPESVTT